MGNISDLQTSTFYRLQTLEQLSYAIFHRFDQFGPTKMHFKGLAAININREKLLKQKKYKAINIYGAYSL